MVLSLEDRIWRIELKLGFSSKLPPEITYKKIQKIYESYENTIGAGLNLDQIKDKLIDEYFEKLDKK